MSESLEASRLPEASRPPEASRAMQFGIVDILCLTFVVGLAATYLRSHELQPYLPGLASVAFAATLAVIVGLIRKSMAPSIFWAVLLAAMMQVASPFTLAMPNTACAFMGGAGLAIVITICQWLDTAKGIRQSFLAASLASGAIAVAWLQTVA